MKIAAKNRQGLKWKIVGKQIPGKKIRQERKEKEDKPHLYVVATEANGQGHKLEELVQWSQYDNVGK